MANKKPINGFNPVKEEKDGVMARRQIWSSQAINMAYEGLKAGKKLVANPFYENNTKLLKAELNFQRTPEEMEEYIKCMNDILYFATKCKLMTPQGIKNVTLRDYQVEYLKHLQNNRLSIFLACRQCGKCFLLDTQIVIKPSETFFENIDYKLKNYLISSYFNKEEDCFIIPMFELYNLYDNSILWKVKYQLYKLLYKIRNNGKNQ